VGIGLTRRIVRQKINGSGKNIDRLISESIDAGKPYRPITGVESDLVMG